MYPKLNSYLGNYACHSIDDDDIEAVKNALQAKFLTTGETVEKFENDLGSYLGSHTALACSSGTAALHLANVAAGIGREDYVIVPSVTFLATANAARYCGAEVVFSDVDPETGLINTSSFEQALRRCPQMPKAVYPVHIAGQPVNMIEISEIAKKNNIAVVEDACHALGTIYSDINGEHLVGDLYYSDYATFSFHPAKNITTGEGGAVVSKCQVAADRIKRLRSHGVIKNEEILRNKTNATQAFDADGDKNQWYYEMIELGYNYRMTDIQAALGISQLKKLEKFKSLRYQLKSHYDKLLSKVSDFIVPVPLISDSYPCWHLYSVLIDFVKIGISRNDLMKKLKQKGIGTQVHYIPLHLQPYYVKRYGAMELPGASKYYDKQLSLPLHTNMTLTDVEYIVDCILGIINN